MSNIPKVIGSVVENDLCIGCGLCVYKCSTNSLEMFWNEYGFLIPKLTGSCDLKCDCLSVCPFNPFPNDDVKTENELAQLYLNETTQFHKEIGKYNRIYAGYAKDFRLTSSSGGLATYIFTELLERGVVNHIFSVKESVKPDTHYEYTISSSREELLSASKTKYYPVTLGTVFPKIHELEGNVAIVGVACFIKAVRLAQHSEPGLKEKIPFLLGIICGGVKSRFFTEYLGAKAGVSLKSIVKPQFRLKDLDSTAADYSFGCYDEASNNDKIIKMRSVGNMWGTGFFKSNACDFCDDVTTELADISLGDAWIQPFVNDGRGTNIIVTRSFLADNLIQDGIKSGKLHLEQLPLERFIASQQGSFNHRHSGLSVRLKMAKSRNITIPPKRYVSSKISIAFKITQKLRMVIRKKSLESWKKTLSAKSFDEQMKFLLACLTIMTRMYHYRRGVVRYFKNLMS